VAGEPGGGVLAPGEVGNARGAAGECEEGTDAGGGLVAGGVGVEGEDGLAVEVADLADLVGGELPPGLGERAVVVGEVGGEGDGGDGERVEGALDDDDVAAGSGWGQWLVEVSALVVDGGAGRVEVLGWPGRPGVAAEEGDDRAAGVAHGQ